MNLYKSFFKRAIDVAASGGALLVLSLPLAAVTVWLHFANKGAGAFFFQERPGKDGKIFRVVKFKTMTDERDADGNLLPDAQRLTKVGRLVRSTSIDELPQLWNVLKGDMSLIGPRPLRTYYLPLYSKEQARRHENVNIHGVTVIGSTSKLPSLKEEMEVEAVYCPLGNNRLRVKFLSDARQFGYKTPNYIHPDVHISPKVEIDNEGVYILGNTYIMPEVTIEKDVMISVGANIIHHSTLHRGVFISNGVNLGQASMPWTMLISAWDLRL